MCLSVCMSVCAIAESPLLDGLETSGQVLGSLKTSLLCLMGELAGRGSVIVAVGLSYR